MFSSRRLLACLLLPVTAGAQAALTPHQKAARDVYEQLVEINTVDSVGSVTTAVQAMAARFRAAGFPAADLHIVIPPGAPTKGNLVVRYRGRGGALKPVLLLAHLDVVAALRTDWSRDPFELQEADGFFYGRGTADDKAMASMFVANLLRYRKEGFVPTRDLILALTADEEGGASNGVEYLVTHHRNLIDAAYAINEGGGGTLSGTTPLFHSVQAAEKVPVNFTLTVLNPGGHSSVPRPDNAINQLAQGLVNLAHYTFPVALNAITKPFLEETAKVEKPDVAAAMRAVAANPRDSVAAATLSKDPRYSSMLRTSCVATRLGGGHAYNALPQTATANVNCRIVPTSTLEEVKASIERVLNDTSIHVALMKETTEKFGVAPDAIDPTLLSSATSLTKQKWGDIPVIPTMSTGATDGRFLRAIGIPTYGVSGIFSQPGENNAHGRDEKLRTRSFYEGLDFLYELVKQVSGTIAM
ncbi:MAG: M20/M25/M40 family metallo-hydrolase [Gemmatimonadaceae bacterium]|nr:M20/M25/M40 family metallo-hydrolase [Gemmatimonadaceae bacterium]